MPRIFPWHTIEKMKAKKPDAKATGWKIPLIFCGAIILIALVGRFILPAGPNLPEIPQSLLELAKNRKIDLDKPEGKDWKEQMVSAASGFAAPEAKDYRLAAIIDSALAQKRFDAACAAAVLMRLQDDKNRALKNIFAKASQSCEEAPWAVFAIRGLGNAPEAADLTEILAKKWQQCEK